MDAANGNREKCERCESSTAVRELERFRDGKDCCRIAVLNRLGQWEPRKRRNDAKGCARGTGQETRPTLSNEIGNQTKGGLAYGTRAKQPDDIGKLNGRGPTFCAKLYATLVRFSGRPSLDMSCLCHIIVIGHSIIQNNFLLAVLGG